MWPNADMFYKQIKEREEKIKKSSSAPMSKQTGSIQDTSTLEIDTSTNALEANINIGANRTKKEKKQPLSAKKGKRKEKLITDAAESNELITDYD
jgi:hypothetical protein